MKSHYNGNIFVDSNSNLFLDQFGKDGVYQRILKRIELSIVPRELCIQQLRETKVGPDFQLHESFICAGIFFIELKVFKNGI